MMDRLINTEKKRFVVATTLYVLLMLLFFLGLFRVSSILVSISKASDLLILTLQQSRAWYWPIELVANLMDQRITFFSVIDVTIVSLPIGFWIASILMVYIGGFSANKDNVLYVHQQRFMVFIVLSWIGGLAHMLLFVYGFFGGSVATAIARVNVCGYVGMVISVTLSLLSIIMLSMLWIDVHSNLRT